MSKRGLTLNRKRKAAAVLLALLSYSWCVQAADEEGIRDYRLAEVLVEEDAPKDQFGNTITEQSYYRTGGDVNVITRDEIEKHHYADISDAIKHVPGVTISNFGYRGGEYGSSTYNNNFSINGDARVIVLVDGRRVDNSTSTRFGSSSTSNAKTLVNIDQIVSMDAVDKIEVIKGPGASIYGADATGGVINIITRKGGLENRGSIDVSTGSWSKHIYRLNYSGSAGPDRSWRYFFSASRQMSGDSDYHDGLTGRDYSYLGTAYKEEGVTLRIDKDFSDTENLKIWYNHMNGRNGYPISAPDYRYWSQSEWDRILDYTENGLYGATTNPGYRNLFVLDALSGSYNAYRNNDWDISYTFNKENGMESFVRVYDQKHHYWGVDRYPTWVESDGTHVPFPGGSAWDDFIANYEFRNGLEPTTRRIEQNRGVQLQLGKQWGIHDVLMSVTYDHAKTYIRRYNRNSDTWTTTNVERDSVLGFLQDKIHITDKWDITPAVRYSHYSTFSNRTESGETTVDNSSSTLFTPTIHTQYAFDDTFSAYLGWTKVYRPIRSSDYDTTTPNGAPLDDEKGDVWTLGIRKDIGDRTTLTMHYDWTDMSNAVTRYSVWIPDDQEFSTRAVNAKETKKSFNVTLDHRFNDHWSIGLSYTHLKDKWKAKDGMEFDPYLDITDTDNVNTMINRLRPQNHYTANVSYEAGKWYSGLLVNWYTGMNTTAFTNRRALVLDWSLNYEVNEAITTYMTVTNLTNEAYETAYYSYIGVGAAPQPGRAFMFGVKYNF